MLVPELIEHQDDVGFVNPTSDYHNKTLGDSSFLLAGLLGQLLKEVNSEWNEERWIDDSLIRNVFTDNEKLIIEGVMIWGEMDTTEQWVDFFYFDIELLRDKISYKEFTFLFCDLDFSKIKYEHFSNNRDYYRSGKNRKWKYVINSNEI
jgi:aminoglycoside phosphotransferase (APT) family kinase protein